MMSMRKYSFTFWLLGLLWFIAIPQASAGGTPTPGITANGSHNPITVSPTTPININVNLDPGNAAGQYADWWAVAYGSSLGWYSYVYPNGWVQGIVNTAQSPLFNLSQFNVFSGYLPSDQYTFYFGVDMTPDKIINEPLFYDSVQVAVNANSCLSDDFNGSALDGTKWDVFKGNPTVTVGNLILAGTSGTRAEIQSKTGCQSGSLQASITSSDWKAQSGTSTDSSFGLEYFTGTNGQCHYAVILVANGHLGLLRAEPDAQGNCSGDPKYQEYPKISNWDAVRTGAGGRIDFTLTWSLNNATLFVSDGGSNTGVASYTGDTVPAIPLKIRLNADFNETYKIDYIHTTLAQ